MVLHYETAFFLLFTRCHDNSSLTDVSLNVSSGIMRRMEYVPHGRHIPWTNHTLDETSLHSSVVDGLSCQLFVIAKTKISKKVVNMELGDVFKTVFECLRKQISDLAV